MRIVNYMLCNAQSTRNLVYVQPEALVADADCALTGLDFVHGQGTARANLSNILFKVRKIRPCRPSVLETIFRWKASNSARRLTS